MNKNRKDRKGIRVMKTNRFRKELATILVVALLLSQLIFPMTTVFSEDLLQVLTEKIQLDNESKMPSILSSQINEMFSVFEGMSKVSYGYTDVYGEKIIVQEKQNEWTRAVLDSSEYTPYTFRTELDGYWAEGQMPVLKIDGEEVFCIEPGVTAYEGEGYSPTELPTNINVKITRIGSIGYGKNKHHEGYLTSQGYIWETMGASFSTSYSGYASMKTKIDQDIANFYITPSFAGQNVTVKMGEPVTLTDTNNVLSEYTRNFSTGGIHTNINGNKLTLTVDENTDDNALVKMSKPAFEGTSIAYIKEGSQTVAQFKLKDPPIFLLNVEAIKTGDLKIKKVDKDTGEVIPKTEFDVTYSGNTQKVITDANGEGEVKGIIHDTKVTVTETFVPAPYYIDESNTKEVTIKGGQVTSVAFQNKKVTGTSTITKTDKTTGTNEPLNPNYPLVGARYGWFKEDGTLVKEFTFDESLTATIDNQPLGNYYWLETYAPVGHTLDTTKHVVKLEYKDQYTPVVVQDADSQDDVIRMNMDGQKKIVNPTNEMYKDGVELTATNQRTGEQTTTVTQTIDGKKGYFQFTDLPLDDYVIEETKGVEGYENITPMEVNHEYIKEEDSFLYTVIDQESGNLLNEEKITQEELAKGKNVDLGSYTLKDQGIYDPESSVTIKSQAHIGDNETQTFVWGDKQSFHDNLLIAHQNVKKGTERAFESILVAVYTDEEGKKTSEDVWTSGKITYEVDKDELNTSVQADYDYRDDPRGTTYYFKAKGYHKVEEELEDTENDTEKEEEEESEDSENLMTRFFLGKSELVDDALDDTFNEIEPPVSMDSFEYIEDVTHNLDGLDNEQTLTPYVEEEDSVIVPPKEETPPTQSIVEGLLPNTGDSLPSFMVKVIGWLLFSAVLYAKRKQLVLAMRRKNYQMRRYFATK